MRKKAYKFKKGDFVKISYIKMNPFQHWQMSNNGKVSEIIDIRFKKIRNNWTVYFKLSIDGGERNFFKEDLIFVPFETMLHLIDSKNEV